MKKLSALEIRQIQLSILDEVDSFCKSAGITYSLCGGTMLGAVRHRGYIPWDDDIDVMMPRTDYDKFLSLYSSEENELIDLSSIESCNEQFVKVFRKGTWMEDTLLHRRLWGVCIDTFPIDGMPGDFEPYADFLCQIHDRVIKYCPLYLNAGRHRGYWHLRYKLKTLFTGSETDVLSLKEALNSIVRKNRPEDSPLSTVIFGDFKIFPFPSSLFYNISEIEFEGKRYACIADTDTYLRTVYGDYMTPPPVYKRISRHLYDSWSCSAAE